MRFSPQEIEEKFAKMTSHIQETLSSPEIADALTRIGKDFNLHVDQIGILVEETTYFILGLQNQSSYEKQLAKSLNLEGSTLIKLLNNLNEKVFLHIRELVQEKESVDTPGSTPNQEETKENILAEIENPTPTIQPISRVDQTIPGPATPREITPAKENIAHEFIAGKLTETVSLPPQKKTYPADPYREPLA